MTLESICEYLSTLPLQLDVRRWRVEPGCDVYPAADPCQYRMIVWQKREGWAVEVEERTAFSWERVTFAQIINDPTDLAIPAHRYLSCAFPSVK